MLSHSLTTQKRKPARETIINSEREHKRVIVPNMSVGDEINTLLFVA